MAKFMFPVINMVCITAFAYFCVQGIYMEMGIGPMTVLEENISQGPDVDKKQTRTTINNLRQRNNTIISRNLFNVLPEMKKSADGEKNRVKRKIVRNEKAPIQLRLKGTVTGGSDLYAVIEDMKKRDQSLYKTGEDIEGAVLKQVFKDHVLLERDGEEIRLEMSVEKGGANPRKSFKKNTPASGPKPKIRVSEIPLDEAFINDSLSDLESVRQQVKFRTHHKNGKKDGILLYGIKPESVFKAMGLRNGDIVQQVDDEPVESIDDAIEALKNIEDDYSAQISILRSGQPRQLVFKLNANSE